MQIVHFGHSCVLIKTDSARLLFDPGTFSNGFEQTTGLSAILITHKHPDHLDGARLPALVEANPDAALVSDEDSAAELEKLGLAPTSVARPGDTFTFGGTSVTAVGGRHATIHEDLPTPANAGYVVDDGAFYHPGDALFVPEQRIDVLGLPMSAPWLKTGEIIDFVRAVGPRVAVPIHEVLLSEIGMRAQQNWLSQLAPDSEFRPLPKGEPVDL
ncbi:MBL fold metallo-hydrolase [Actinophytocola sp. NPDC049390]|uniref:MBL fold metallo-hydrolase n=1 Tax=Actinophytocola sp. NPDC049390 TaxID=3363894 RepID=UPI003792C5CF